ncbi:MAG TPA: DUF262 domain-containing protein [Massilia sp.]|nr:DUF262 domain-containing protein [Massilia sp.]
MLHTLKTPDLALVGEASFGAQLMCLPEIFQDRLFTVPDYQRGYAWDDKQVEELLKDLDHLMDDSAAHRHYAGTLVVSKVATSNKEVDYHVVDGQQRLTTLITLLRVLAEHLPAEARAGFDSLYLRRGPVGADRSVLRLNSDTRQFFERVIMGGGNPNNEPMYLEAHERLLKARKLIAKWMRERIDAGTAVASLRRAIEQKLGFLVYAPKENAETGIMFEVINNRGKPLSELEKVKNYLIYCSVKLGASTLRESIDEHWSAILRDLNEAKKTSPGDESAFLRYCMVVHFRLNKTDSQYGYNELKKRLALDVAMKDDLGRQAAVQEIAAFVNFMKLAALWYARLYGRKHAGIPAGLIPILDQIRGQDRHASIMPIFLALVIRHEGRGLALQRLLELVEKMNFRVYMARGMTARNDTGQGDLYGYAAAYYHGDLLAGIPEEERKLRKQTLQDDEQALEYRLVEFALAYCPDSKLESSLKLEQDSSEDFYDWGGLRYFLMNYEQALQPHKTIQIDKITLARKEGKSADYLSVEHRWAVENRNEQGENNRAIDRFEKRRLGNFVLLELRLNIQASNASLEEKLAHYMGKDEEPQTDLQQVRKMVRDAEAVLKEMKNVTRSKNYYLNLHRKINDQAEERFAKFALKRWTLKDYLGFSEIKKRADSGWDDEGEA